MRPTKHTAALVLLLGCLGAVALATALLQSARADLDWVKKNAQLVERVPDLEEPDVRTTVVCWKSAAGFDMETEVVTNCSTLPPGVSCGAQHIADINDQIEAIKNDGGQQVSCK